MNKTKPVHNFDIVSALLTDAAALVRAARAELNESLAVDRYLSEEDTHRETRAVQDALNDLLLTVDATDFDEAQETAADDDLPIEILRNLNGIAVITAKAR